MHSWTPQFDLSTIPDALLHAESARRRRAAQVDPPRAKVYRQCPGCGEAFGARELRAHRPRCKSTRMTETVATSARRLQRVVNQQEQDAANFHYWQGRSIAERLYAVCEVTEAAYSIRKA